MTHPCIWMYMYMDMYIMYTLAQVHVNTCKKSKVIGATCMPHWVSAYMYMYSVAQVHVGGFTPSHNLRLLLLVSPPFLKV